MSDMRRLEASLSKPGVYMDASTKETIRGVTPVGRPLLLLVKESESLVSRIKENAPENASGYETSRPTNIGSTTDWQATNAYAIQYLTWEN